MSPRKIWWTLEGFPENSLRIQQRSYDGMFQISSSVVFLPKTEDKYTLLDRTTLPGSGNCYHSSWTQSQRKSSKKTTAQLPRQRSPRTGDRAKSCHTEQRRLEVNKIKMELVWCYYQQKTNRKLHYWPWQGWPDSEKQSPHHDWSNWQREDFEPITRRRGKNFQWLEAKYSQLKILSSGSKNRELKLLALLI